MRRLRSVTAYFLGWWIGLVGWFLLNSAGEHDLAQLVLGMGVACLIFLGLHPWLGFNDEEELRARIERERKRAREERRPR